MYLRRPDRRLIGCTALALGHLLTCPCGPLAVFRRFHTQTPSNSGRSSRGPWVCAGLLWPRAAPGAFVSSTWCACAPPLVGADERGSNPPEPRRWTGHAPHQRQSALFVAKPTEQLARPDSLGGVRAHLAGRDLNRPWGLTGFLFWGPQPSGRLVRVALAGVRSHGLPPSACRFACCLRLPTFPTIPFFSDRFLVCQARVAVAGHQGTRGRLARRCAMLQSGCCMGVVIPFRGCFSLTDCHWPDTAIAAKRPVLHRAGFRYTCQADQRVIAQAGRALEQGRNAYRTLHVMQSTDPSGPYSAWPSGRACGASPSRAPRYPILCSRHT